jgi:phosphoserine phosphatase
LLDIVRYQHKNGILPCSSLSAMENCLDFYAKGGLDYEEMAQNVLIHWPEGLKGKALEQVTSNTKEFFQTEGKKFLPFVQESVNLLQPTHDIYFVTAEPQFVAEEVTRINQATGYFSTIFEIEHGIFTGNVSSSLARKEDKGNITRQLMLTHNWEQSFAFGDSDNDIEMLEGVEYPICVNPNSKLKKVREEKEWETIEPNEIILFVANKINTSKNNN